MNTSNTRCKKALLLAMIAATGIPASLASAQFKVEYVGKDQAKAQTQAEQDLNDDKAVWVFEDADNDHTYKLKVINGQIEYASIDGKELKNERVKINDQVVVFLSDDGETLHEFKLHDMPQTLHDGEKKFVIRSWTNDGDVIVSDDKNSFYKAFGGPGENDYVIEATIELPKVMLGINLGEPSKVLRKHLKLKDGVHAILVEGVIDGLPADKAGLEDFDVIISIDGSDQADGEILRKILNEKEPGDQMKLIVLRSGEKVKLKVKLAAYDAKMLGSVPMRAIVVDQDAIMDRDLDKGFPFLERLNDGEFGNFEPLKLERLKGELRKFIAQTESQHKMAPPMRAKAMDAMKDAERQIVEFRDGKLIVRSMEDLDRQFGRLNERLHVEVRDLHPEIIRNHMGELDERLSDLEDRIDHQMGRMSDQMDRLADMFERLMDRLEDDED